MIARLIACLRSLRAYWLWLAEVHEMAKNDDAVYAADTAELKRARHPSLRDCPTFDCAVCLELHGVRPDPRKFVTSLDPTRVGRQAVEGDAILDVSAWLASSGFADMPAGERQQYAAWILKTRAAYEKAQVTAL